MRAFIKRDILAAALLLFGASGLRAEPRLSAGAVAIPRSSTASGGGLSSGGGLILDSRVGEVAVATAAGAGFAASPGLMSLIAQPGSVTAITAVAKDTGTLTLSWVSPGLDGFVGGVAAGYWRIDSSSDPAHLFDPTVFTTEFATSVTPGATQSYTLAGLLPNTTYYSRIYLSDARKVVSETSAPSAESSLARVPAAPAFTGVFATSVTISWTLPAGGAEGFRLDASSTGFLGGAVVSSQTPGGTVVTLTVAGLAPATTYFFNLGSLDWQGDADFAVVMSTRTLFPGGVPPISNLAWTGDALGRRATLTWTNPVFPNPAGVTILVSTRPISAALADGTPYPAGTVLADGSVVRSTSPTVSYVQAGLSLDATAYFSLYSRDASNAYSIAVSTFLVLDLPPMAPAGLSGSLSPGATAFLLSWGGVASKLDGSGFAGPAPAAWEFAHYDVYRATGIVAAGWVWIGSAPVSTVAYADAIPGPGVYYYKVVSRDAFDAGLSDAAMAVDTLGNLWAVHPDQITRLEIPAALAGIVQAGGNPSGRPLLIRAEDRPQDLSACPTLGPGCVVKSVAFSPVVSPTNQPAVLPVGQSAGYDVALHYATSAGYVVPSSVGPSAARSAAAAVNDPGSLSAYYVVGAQARQIFGRVDPVAQEVSVQSGLLGDYQVRTVARSQGFSFDVSGVSNRAITPNGDGLNDTVVFTFDNPKDSAFSGRIFDLRGRYVSDMSPGPVAGASLLWDAKSNGRVVPRGVYVYEIRAEGKTFRGTVVVIR